MRGVGGIVLGLCTVLLWIGQAYFSYRLITKNIQFAVIKESLKFSAYLLLAIAVSWKNNKRVIVYVFATLIYFVPAFIFLRNGYITFGL